MVETFNLAERNGEKPELKKMTQAQLLILSYRYLRDVRAEPPLVEAVRKAAKEAWDREQSCGCQTGPGGGSTKT